MKKIITTFGLIIILIKAFAQLPFKPVTWSNEGKLVIPEGMKYEVIFREGDTILSIKGEKGPAKGNHDLNIYIPSKEKGKALMYTSHELNQVSDHSGDGGGGTVYDLEYKNGSWKAFNKTAIDFSPAGGTFNNCSGTLTSKGTVLTTEEGFPPNNKALYNNGKGFRDTSDFNGLKRYQNMGWVVEVDPVSKKALHKLYKMGRFGHEGIWVMNDKRTVYLADDYYPSVFFKFIAEKENDFTSGQLYAYSQGAGGKGGSWIELPMEMDSLLSIREVALKSGATAFVRMEWITSVNGKLYITETGLDNFKADQSILYNGKPAWHLQKDFFLKEKDRYDYPYGGILEFDPADNSIRPLIYGGRGTKDTLKHFSGPDGITHCYINGKAYLVINEDVIAGTRGRLIDQSKWVNEIYWLDLSIKDPVVDDLQRFLIGPPGAETTGGAFSEDGSTYFVNIQHPSSENAYPFNKSVTIAITGFTREKEKKKQRKKK
jgi:secreted PhoX family phosphatase